MGHDVAITRISPLSAFRVGLAMSLVALVAWLLAVTATYFAMDAAGVWGYVNGFVDGVGGDVMIDFGTVLPIAALLGAVMAILGTVAAPLLALIYNAVVSLFGGVVVDLEQIVETEHTPS